MSTPAEPFAYLASDTILSTLQRLVGQRVELRLGLGEKIAGKLEAVGGATVHLSALAGQEFYDAVVATAEVSAVVVRTGPK